MVDKEQNDVVDYHDQVLMRKAKLADITALRNPYPNNYKPNNFAGDILVKYADIDAETMSSDKVEHILCGRIMNRRVMGKASFIHMQDFTGKIQVYIRKDDLSDDLYESFKHWDLGDIICVHGFVFRTKTDEITINATYISLVTKALRPLPDKYHGLTEKEACYRKRYLDLIVNQHTRDVFAIRSNTITAIRNFLVTSRFMEVETPMMHSLPGGATARPFSTHHNALDIPLYMRIAPELFLKRLLVGGIDRVFEINRNFRNEGLSTRHNPEFTMLEFYQAYADYEDFMNFTENMLKHIARVVLQKDKFSFQGYEIDFASPFAKLTITDAILQYNPDMQPSEISDLASARVTATSLGIKLDGNVSLGVIKLEIFEKTVEKKLIQPTFILDYPTDASPLSRKSDNNPDIVDRFELFIGGQEIANGFSELNDPADQAERFQRQVKAKLAGDQEAMSYDDDYVTALEYGMPPAAGTGIGIDRLVMLLTNSAAIRDVILFPLLKPIQEED